MAIHPLPRLSDLRCRVRGGFDSEPRWNDWPTSGMRLAHETPHAPAIAGPFFCEGGHRRHRDRKPEPTNDFGSQLGDTRDQSIIVVNGSGTTLAIHIKNRDKVRIVGFVCHREHQADAAKLLQRICDAADETAVTIVIKRTTTDESRRGEVFEQYSRHGFSRLGRTGWNLGRNPKNTVTSS